MSEYINSHQDMGPLRCEWQPAAVDRVLSILPQLIYHPLHAYTHADACMHSLSHTHTHIDNIVCENEKARHTHASKLLKESSHREEDLH